MTLFGKVNDLTDRVESATLVPHTFEEEKFLGVLLRIFEQSGDECGKIVLLCGGRSVVWERTGGEAVPE